MNIFKPYSWHEYYDLEKKLKQYTKHAKFLTKVILFVPNTAKQLKHQIQYRFFEKYHYLKTGFDKDRFYDLDDRILYAVFNEFQRYIEEEKAALDETGDFLAYLDYEMSLGKEPDEDNPFIEANKCQAECAKEQLALYLWWKVRQHEEYVSDEQSKEDDEMLIRLMKIRGSLWT